MTLATNVGRFARLIKKQKKKLKKAFARRTLERGLARLAIKRVTTRFSPRRAPQAASLVVSLTSFPPRIERVHLVIQSLLTQTLQPHRIVLYLSQQEFPNRTLPQRLARLAQLAKDRFEIRFVEGNLGPYKKLLCALSDFSGSPIVTCDDDRIYPPQLLA